MCYDTAGNAVYLTLMNMGDDVAELTVIANAYRQDGPWTYRVDPGMQVEPRWSLAASHSWYDFTVTMDNGFERRFAGRLETGTDGWSDPEMGAS